MCGPVVRLRELSSSGRISVVLVVWLTVSKAFTREDDVAEPEVVHRPVVPSITYLTKEGAERLARELAALEGERGQMTDQDAPVARQNSQEINRRIRELQQTLASCVVVEPAGGNNEIVQFGRSVTVRSSSDGEVSDYRIVGLAEVDVERGWISAASPLAQALLNHKAGERIQFKYPAGEDTLEIISVS